MNLPLNYDLHGINDSEGSRIATFSEWLRMSGEGADAYGRLFASAPEMLAQIDEYLDLFLQMKESEEGEDKRHIIDRMNNLRKEMIITTRRIHGKV